MNKQLQKRSRQRRERIFKVAMKAFLKQGYAATSMSAIAEEVGGSKATLYSYVKNKQDLFIQCIEQLILDHSAQAFESFDMTTEPRRALTDFCRIFIGFLVSRKGQALTRLVIGEARRFPEIGRFFYDRALLSGRQQLADCLERAMAAGNLRPADPEIAARLLIGFCQSGLNQQCLHSVIGHPGADAIAAEARQVADTFMFLYGIAGQEGASPLRAVE